MSSYIFHFNPGVRILYIERFEDPDKSREQAGAMISHLFENTLHLFRFVSALL